MRRWQLMLCAVVVASSPACSDALGEDREFLKGPRERIGKVRDFIAGPKKRPCIDHEECLSKEHCSQGYCEPYKKRTVATPRPDMGRAR